MRCWSTSQTVKNGAGHTGFSRNALAKTDPFAVHNSPVTNAVLDQQGTLAIRTVEMWTRLVLANLTVKGCLHYDTCTPYMYVVQVYGVHVS